MSPKNTCPCPVPPGGEARCESDQLAICRIENGAQVTECLDLPQPNAERHVARRIANAILQAIYSSKRHELQRVTAGERQLLLSSVRFEKGRGETRDDYGNAVSFRIPANLGAVIDALEDEAEGTASASF